MATLDEILKRYPTGVLNEFSYDRFSMKLDKYTENNHVQIIRSAIGKILSTSTKDRDDGPYRAVCLSAIEDPAGEIPGETKVNGSLVLVKARIPKLHKSLPRPIDPETMRTAILMHPTFYAVSGTKSLPKPGNIVLVDFRSINNVRYGEFLEIVSSNQEASLVGGVAARDVMEQGDQPASLVGDFANSQGIT